MRALVVRHFKTLVNVADQIMGWGDAPRAKAWANDLKFIDKRLRALGVQFDSIHSSFLERARQTAMYYARSRKINVIHDSIQLNEINYGPLLFRKSKVWVSENIPQHKKDPDFVYPDGESFRQMQERSVQHLCRLATRNPDDTVLLVVHAGVIRGLVSHYLDLEYSDNLKRRISHRYIGEFHITDGICTHYNELGKPSGFVNDKVVRIPWASTSSRQS